MLYRDAEFVERCFCEEPAAAWCACCGRTRCGRHLARGLCNRCTQFLERSLAERSTTSWYAGGTVGVGATLAMLAAGAGSLSILMLPLAIVAGFAHRRFQRSR